MATTYVDNADQIEAFRTPLKSKNQDFTPALGNYFSLLFSTCNHNNLLQNAVHTAVYVNLRCTPTD